MPLDPCPHCEGGGELMSNPSFPRDPQRDEYHRCPFCGGSGVMCDELEDAAWAELEKRSPAALVDLVNDMRRAA